MAITLMYVKKGFSTFYEIAILFIKNRIFEIMFRRTCDYPGLKFFWANSRRTLLKLSGAIPR